MAVLAIDQGTTSTRALLLDEAGESRVIKVLEHQQFYPRPGWVEHDPEEIVANIRACMSAAQNLQAIGIDNQGESCLAWDAQSKKAISPIIVWQDNRSQGELEKLGAQGAAALVMARAGLPLDAYFSASKLGWILENIPAAKTLHKKGRLRLGTTDAFFLDRLSGRFVTDITTASRTSLLNLERGAWDPELCALFGVPIECLPTIVPSMGDFGVVDINAQKIPIRASLVDQQASLYGHGCRNAGDAKITFGTGAFALAITGDKICLAPERGLLPTVAWQKPNSPPVYALDGGVYCAGSAVNWARGIGLFKDYAQINQFGGASAIARGLVFVPALAGLACPHWDRRAAGLWIGLGLATGALDMMQSLLEGIAFRAAEVIAAMGDFVTLGSALSIDGGLSANPYFCQFLADLLQREVKVQQAVELTALGTALLASETELPAKTDHDLVLRYQPRQDLELYRDRFSDAVQRARAWHD